jgi:hypothetical protein
MTAEPSENSASKGTRSLEVRWIFPGKPSAAVTRWFARFPARAESRTDRYLLDPPSPVLSVKVRGGAALEVKAYLGSPGRLEVGSRARGRMEYWHKWSFPVSPPGGTGGHLPGWQPVRKIRRISQFSSLPGPIVARRGGLPPWCEVELTKVTVAGRSWWTLGFEASGPAEGLRDALEATAALVFAHPLPDGVEAAPDQSRSYAKWLGQQGSLDS